MSAETAVSAPSEPSVPDRPKAARLASIDALRGFDMFWIIGGENFVPAVAAFFGWSRLHGILLRNLEHAKWNGFTAYDLIFPLFLLLSGATMSFSLTRRLEQGERKWVLFWRIFRRMALLILLGMASQGLFKLKGHDQRYASVLGLIGVAYFWAGLVVINRGVRGQILWAAGILVGYWAAMTLIPVPGVGPGVLTPEGYLGGYIDRHLLPGKLYAKIYDPEGLFVTIPAAALALMGALAGHLLRSNIVSGGRKALFLCSAGVVSMALGWLWGRWFPINKQMWTSSFILFAGGLSLVLLALFYLAIDVWGWRKWAFPFIVIGMNPITIYVGAHFINFRFTSDALFAGLARLSGESLEPVVSLLGLLAVEWAFLYFLYRKRIFLRA